MSSEVADYVWARQYAHHAGETFEQGVDRVVDHVVGDRKELKRWAPYWRAIIKSKRFIPGGRVLAGAASNHGNLQNCFVQGPTAGYSLDSQVLDLAKKLALVTKVGGGNGVNLDFIPAKREYRSQVGNLWLYIDPDHPDYEDVRTGTFLDQVTGQRVTRGYHTAYVSQHPDRPFEAIVKHQVPDSVEGIWETAHKVVLDLLQGRNVLVDLSELRPEGTPVQGSGGTSSGPASFAVEVFDNFAKWAKLGGADYAGPVATLRYVFAPTLRVIRQAGVRRGAGMATLSITHPDVMDFVTAKTIEREKAEGDISTFNISVLVRKEDITELMEGRDTPVVAALKAAVAQAWATGEPGFLFVDRINRHNALAEVDGPIVATNPCGEQPLYPGESCNLGAINVAAYWDELDRHFQWNRLWSDVKAAVRFLDAVHDADNSPLPEIREQTKDKRRLGLGLMGLGDLLIKMGIRYGSKKAQEFAEDLARSMTAAAIEASEELAEEFGACPAWERVPDHVKYGRKPRRNIALMTVAPTGTISMLAGVSSGIEPVYSATIKRRIGTEYKTIKHPLAEYPHFITAHQVSPKEHVKMQAAVQRGFDWDVDGRPSAAGNAISKTINLPNSASVDSILDALVIAYVSGSKGFTCYRDGSRDLQVLTEVKEGDKAPDDAPAPFDEAEYRDVEQLATLERRKPVRPAVVAGKTYRYKVGDRKVYVTVNRDEHDHPIEVFVNLSRPTDKERVAADIIGRLISLALKHGAPAEDVVRHLSGHMDGTGSFATTDEEESKPVGYFGTLWEAVARAIQDDASPVTEVQQEARDESCPSCGEPTLVKEGTCTHCEACGWSKCG